MTESRTDKFEECLDIKEYDKLSLKQKFVRAMTLYGYLIYEQSSDDCFIAIVQEMGDKRLRDIRVKNAKKKIVTLARALVLISDEGFWSNKLTVKQYLKLLDEHKKLADEALAEIENNG